MTTKMTTKSIVLDVDWDGRLEKRPPLAAEECPRRPGRPDELRTLPGIRQPSVLPGVAEESHLIRTMV
jgi:hypothetical protein